MKIKSSFIIFHFNVSILSSKISVSTLNQNGYILNAYRLDTWGNSRPACELCRHMGRWNTRYQYIGHHRFQNKCTLCKGMAWRNPLGIQFHRTSMFSFGTDHFQSLPHTLFPLILKELPQTRRWDLSTRTIQLNPF